MKKKIMAVLLAFVLCGTMAQAQIFPWWQPAEATNYQVQTSATGATWVQLTNAGCARVTLSTSVASGTSVPIEIRRGSSATFGFVLPADSAKTFRGINNASTLWVRRADQSNTQVTIVYETEGGGF